MSDGHYRRMWSCIYRRGYITQIGIAQHGSQVAFGFWLFSVKDLSRTSSRKRRRRRRASEAVAEKKLIAVNDDINHKKMKPSAVDNKRQATNEEPATETATATETDSDRDGQGGRREEERTEENRRRGVY